MKSKQVTLYYCDFCSKQYQKKHYAALHESKCSMNPANDRPCFHCEHLTKKEIEIHQEYYSEGREFERKVDLLYCNSNRYFLFPPQVSKEKAFNLDDISNVAMPLTCNLFKKRSLF